MANGYYWNSKKWEVNQDGVGRCIHPLLVLAILPVLGGLFVVFLPVIGFVLAFQALAIKLGKLARPLFEKSVLPVAAPGEAHFLGSKPGGTRKSRAGEDMLEELSREIEKRRRG